jgi:hypothetical protein
MYNQTWSFIEKRQLYTAATTLCVYNVFDKVKENVIDGEYSTNGDIRNCLYNFNRGIWMEETTW